MKKQKHHILGLIVLLLFAVSLACGSSASTEGEPQATQEESAASSAPTEQAEPAITEEVVPEETEPVTVQTTGKVGDRVGGGGVALIVLNVQKVDSVSGMAAENGKKYVDIEVLIENVDRDSAPYNPLYFSVKDSDSYEYSASFLSLDPTLQSGELSKGERARGHVAFEVPNEATGLVVSYSPVVLLGDYEPLKVNLEEISENPAVIEDTGAGTIDGMVGELVESSGMSLMVLQVQTVNELNGMAVDPGMTFLDLETVIQNSGRDEDLPYNPFYFKVKDADSFEYTSAMFSLEPSLKSGTLPKGDVARGHVAFQVPEGATGLIMSYEPEVIFGDYKMIRINLDQTAEQMAEIPTPIVPEGTGQLGAPVESAGIALTVVNSNQLDSLDGFSPDEGNIFIDIEVLIQNISREESTPYNPLYFIIKDDRGFEYNTSFMSVEPTLTAGELVKGDEVRGHVTFEIPTDATGLIVRYEPQVLFGGYEVIRVTLEQ